MAKGKWKQSDEYNNSLAVYCKIDARINRVCVLEDLNFYWEEKELNIIKKMWNQELSVYYMALYFDRDPDEVLLAIIHLARGKVIRNRKSGILEGVIGCFDIKAKVYNKGEKKNGKKN